MPDQAYKTCETCKRSYKNETDYLTDTYQWRLCNADNLWFNCSCGSTLMIPKGKFPWYDPSTFLSDDAKSVFNKIAAVNDLPHIPAAVMKIQSMLNDPNIETTELANAIKRDPFLAAEVLRVAENLRNLRDRHNSPMQSIEHAITYVGRKSIGDLVLAASIRSFQLPTKIFDEAGFWYHAFLTGAIAEVVGRKLTPELDPDKVYLAGSLANVGKVISALCFPDKVDEVHAYVSNIKTMTNWESAELKFDLESHCILGEIGASMWGLPKFVLEAVRFHHTRVDSAKLTSKNAMNPIVGLANLLAHWVNLEPSRLDNDLLAHYRELFSLSENDLDQLVGTDLMSLKNHVVMEN